MSLSGYTMATSTSEIQEEYPIFGTINKILLINIKWIPSQKFTVVQKMIRRSRCTSRMMKTPWCTDPEICKTTSSSVLGPSSWPWPITSTLRSKRNITMIIKLTTKLDLRLAQPQSASQSVCKTSIPALVLIATKRTVWENATLRESHQRTTSTCLRLKNWPESLFVPKETLLCER